MNRLGTEPYAGWCERPGGASPLPTQSFFLISAYGPSGYFLTFSLSLISDMTFKLDWNEGGS